MVLKIALCSSAKFFDLLNEMKESLEKRKYEVVVPNIQRYLFASPQDKMSIRGELLRNYLQEISYCHAIYVANHENKGIQGYIGANVLIEMSKAFELELPIFLLNPIPCKIDYFEELKCMQPLFIGRNWDTLDEVIKEKYGMTGVEAFEIELGNGSAVDPLIFRAENFSKD